ncbi:hypothetical protein ACA910_021749 [Epithemia clementina (nom. ined.)]
MSRSGTVNANSFYSEFRGHKVKHLRKILPNLRASTNRIIWTAGDSSLDNKYWFGRTASAPGHYQSLLDPAISKTDVTYWLNYLCAQGDSHRQRTAAINAAVEASTLNERTYALRPQDVFLRDHIEEQDILVVSVGGNDIALQPCPCTIASILGLLFCMPTICLEKGRACGAVPIDDCCCGCGPSLCSCACACPPCLGYFRHMFGTRIQKYIEALTAKTKPAKVLVCMIYYPDERNTPSWAGPALGALGYNSNPSKLQLLIRKAYEEAISTIQIKGTHVVPVPLYRVLDGKQSSDYIARVEPSPSGGKKMAEFILDMIDRPPSTSSPPTMSNSPAAPLTTSMDRNRQN